MAGDRATQFRDQAGLTDTPNRHFDTVLMGRSTYELGSASPYAHLRQIVFSRTLTSPDPAVRIETDPVETVRTLKQEDGGLGIWLCGGADLAGQLLPEIDELIVKRYRWWPARGSRCSAPNSCRHRSRWPRAGRSSPAP